MNEGKWFVLNGMNPEPWAVGPLSMGRNKTTGKMFPQIGRNQQLAAFQDAVREAIESTAELIDGELELKFYFWRRLDSYDGARSRITKHEVDATNMQKATEDALQGIVTKNDTLVERIQTTIVTQGPDVSPRIVIFAGPWYGFDETEIPFEVWNRINQSASLFDTDDDENVWPPR